MAKKSRYEDSELFKQAQAEIEASRQPWDGVRIPAEFELSSSGVFDIKPGKEGELDKLEGIAGCIWLVGLTTGTAGDWGRLLRFLDHDSRIKELAIPAARLHEDPAILARELATLGLRIISGKERRLVAYIATFDTLERIQSASRLGWMDRTDGGLAFVFPDRVLSAGGHEQVVYQPERYSPTASTVHAAGTLEQWQTHIAARVAGSDVMLFALCAGLAAPWLKIANSDSSILHFWGTTSRGKTTIAQIAASVWGCAVDPAESASLSMIRRWNTTGNGLEGMAENHSDLVLPIDELGAGNAKDYAPLIYQLAGGQGKTAMTASRELRAPRAWRTIAISTGELSLEAKLSEGGKPAKGGLLHRALDIEVNDIAAHMPEAERAEYVSTIKRDCARFYGTAGASVLAAIMAKYPSIQEARAAARDALDDGVKRLQQPHHAPEQVRALRRFALIAFAGMFAARHGVLPIEPSRIWQAVSAIARQWSDSTSGTDQDRIIDTVRAFILKHGGRFQSTNNETHEPQNRAGFHDATNGRWLFTKEALQEAAPGNDAVTIARALNQAGHLFTNDSKLLAQCQTPAGRVRLYSVKDSILDDSTEQALKTGGQSGHRGQTAPEWSLAPVHQEKHSVDSVDSPPDSVHLSTLDRNEWTEHNPHSSCVCPPVHPVHQENSVSHEKTEIIDEVEF